MNCLLLMLDWMLDDGERVWEKNKIRGKRFEGGFSAGGKLNCCDSKVLTQFEHIMIIINTAAAIFSTTKTLKV